MALTKNGISDNIRDELGVGKNQSIALAETLLEIIKSALEAGEDVLVSGFGKFCLKDKEARKRRNQVTGEDAILPAQKFVTFKCSGILRDKINR